MKKSAPKPTSSHIPLACGLLAAAALSIYVLYAVLETVYPNLGILYGWTIYEPDPVERGFTLWFTMLGLLATAGITVGLALLLPSRTTTTTKHRNITLVAVAIVFALVLSAKFLILHNSPTMDDENVYRFSARLLLHGELSVPTNIPGEFFGQRWGVHYHNGRLYPMYSFGWPAILAVGYAIRMPWIISPLIAVGVLLLTLDFARRVFSEPVARLATLLFLTSPLLILTAATDLSPPSAAFCALATAVCAHRYTEDTRVRWLWIAGIAAGVAFQIRQLNAIAMAVPFFLYLFYQLWRSRKVLRIAALVVPVLLSAALYLTINYVMTGDPLLTSYSREFASRGVTGGTVIGFGANYPIQVGGTGIHTFGQGTLNSCLNLIHFNIWLLGWPLSLLLPLLAPFNVWTRLCLAALTLEAALYTTFYSPGLSVTGPTYLFDSGAFLVVLTAAAIVRAGAWYRSQPLAARAMSAQGAFVTAIVIVNLAMFLPMELRSISGTTEGTSMLPQTLDRENVHHAVVFVKNVQGPWKPEIPYKSFSYHPASNASFDEDVIILNTVSPEKDRDALHRYFADRKGYRYSVDDAWKPQLEVVE